MNEATQKMVEELAAKLGTTAEHLWGVLVRQAPISSLCDVLAIAAWFAGLVWAFRLVTRKTTENENGDAEWGYEGVFWAWTVWGVTAGILVLVAGCSFATIVSGFLNPEYWALKQVLP